MPSEPSHFFKLEARKFMPFSTDLMSEHSPEKLVKRTIGEKSFSGVEIDRFFHQVLDPNKPEYFKHVFDSVFKPKGYDYVADRPHMEGVFTARLIGAAAAFKVTNLEAILSSFKRHPQTSVKNAVIRAAGQGTARNSREVLLHFKRAYGSETRQLAEYYLKRLEPSTR